AAKNGHKAVVKLLLAIKGVDVNSKDLNAKNGHEAVVKLLLAIKGVNADSKDKDGETSL
ncbi:hypothetical protein BKA65DRAFT_411545, partial [Rhexocercosporidium sp. MPI-PUGE-AT-0058]